MHYQPNWIQLQTRSFAISTESTSVSSLIVKSQSPTCILQAHPDYITVTSSGMYRIISSVVVNVMDELSVLTSEIVISDSDPDVGNISSTVNNGNVPATATSNINIIRQIHAEQTVSLSVGASAIEPGVSSAFITLSIEQLF